MVRDAHWQCEHDFNFHRFSSWFFPRQLFAAVVVALPLVHLLVSEQRSSSRRVGAICLWVIARVVVTTGITQTPPSQPTPRQTGTRHSLDTSTLDTSTLDTSTLNTSTINVTRANAPFISTQHTPSTSQKPNKIALFDEAKSADTTTSARYMAVPAGAFMFLTAMVLTAIVSTVLFLLYTFLTAIVSTAIVSKATFSMVVACPCT